MVTCDECRFFSEWSNGWIICDRDGGCHNELEANDCTHFEPSEEDDEE